ncbi:MAG: hypothetical protein E7581_02145 [Ruminococcaceae bacterium]|nr:hypothetical protein [Oscillospiraceae bacterium]
MIKKLFRKIRDAILGLGEIPANTREFGLRIAMIRYRRKLGLISVERYVDAISIQMEKELREVTERYKQDQVARFEKKHDFGDKIPVFMCWFQGKDAMPEWCRACYENLLRIAPPNTEVVLLTYENYQSFVDIPKVVTKKYQEGKMCAANYSDMVRYMLLATYGGCWIDAAVYLNDGVFQTAFTHELYTPRFYREGHPLEDASRGRWVGGVWFSKTNHILFSYVTESLMELWSKHDRALEYLACDYIIWTAYSNLSTVRQQLDAIPVNNEHFRLLNACFEQAYTEQLLEEIFSKQQIHLVDRHKEYKKQKDGQQTVYGYLVSKQIKS